MAKLTNNDAVDLLRRRRLARKVGNDAEVNSIDREISRFVNAGCWPSKLTRADSEQSPLISAPSANPG